MSHTATETKRIRKGCINRDGRRCMGECDRLLNVEEMQLARLDRDRGRSVNNCQIKCLTCVRLGDKERSKAA